MSIIGGWTVEIGDFVTYYKWGRVRLVENFSGYPQRCVGYFHPVSLRFIAKRGELYSPDDLRSIAAIQQFLLSYRTPRKKTTSRHE